MDNISSVQKHFEILNFFRNEESKRLWSVAEAKVIGRGGIALVSRATNISKTTVTKGLKELENPESIDMDRLRNC